MIRNFSSISHGLESLQVLAEFYFFFIRSFDREETDTIFPERKEMYFILRRIQTGPGNHFVNLFDILYVNRHMVDCAGSQRCSYVLVRFDHNCSKI